ncbi:MAG: hypothetical protein IT384_10405 [Deltaproteobacteria bacterium]|nr:hypothetical protein [Deltaproteobacteria bacterium]
MTARRARGRQNYILQHRYAWLNSPSNANLSPEAKQAGSLLLGAVNEWPDSPDAGSVIDPVASCVAFAMERERAERGVAELKSEGHLFQKRGRGRWWFRNWRDWVFSERTLQDLRATTTGARVVSPRPFNAANAAEVLPGTIGKMRASGSGSGIVNRTPEPDRAKGRSAGPEVRSSRRFEPAERPGGSTSLAARPVDEVLAPMPEVDPEETKGVRAAIRAQLGLESTRGKAG